MSNWRTAVVFWGFTGPILFLGIFLTFFNNTGPSGIAVYYGGCVIGAVFWVLITYNWIQHLKVTTTSLFDMTFNEYCCSLHLVFVVFVFVSNLVKNVFNESPNTPWRYKNQTYFIWTTSVYLIICFMYIILNGTVYQKNVELTQVTALLSFCI